jgi:hypothetical protein
MDEDYGAAAVRHLTDADILAGGQRWVGAGHLVGFAAECAIKYRIKTLRPEQDAPYGHLPEILDVARRHLAGRRATSLHAVLKMSNLMEGWRVSLRYSHDRAVDQARYSLWREHAVRLVGAAGLRLPH